MWDEVRTHGSSFLSPAAVALQRTYVSALRLDDVSTTFERLIFVGAGIGFWGVSELLGLLAWSDTTLKLIFLCFGDAGLVGGIVSPCWVCVTLRDTA